MTLEKQFEQWWVGKYSGWTVVEAAKEAWLEATRQARQEAYEDAARICDERKDNELKYRDASSAMTADDCAKLIRQRLKDLTQDTGE